MKIKQDEKYDGDDWWHWSVWLDGDDVTEVEKVVWKLHPTFPEPEREADNRDRNFRIDASGWGGFVIKADVHMKDGSKKQLRHELELHYPDGTATAS